MALLTQQAYGKCNKKEITCYMILRQFTKSMAHVMFEPHNFYQLNKIYSKSPVKVRSNKEFTSKYRYRVSNGFIGTLRLEQALSWAETFEEITDNVVIAKCKIPEMSFFYTNKLTIEKFDMVTSKNKIVHRKPATSIMTDTIKIISFHKP